MYLVIDTYKVTSWATRASVPGESPSVESFRYLYDHTHMESTTRMSQLEKEQIMGKESEEVKPYAQKYEPQYPLQVSSSSSSLQPVAQQ